MTNLEAVSSEIENDREFKAHVFQQLVELQPFLSPESQVSVLVQLEQDPDDEDAELIYALSLVVSLGEYRLEVEGRDADLYYSLGIAKRKMVQQLEEIYGATIDNGEREAQIQSLLQGEMTLH